ncbi:protein of unknown function [Methylococcus capsulatus]|uniref:Transposase n=1 Tax=Methylococcus capsulatus TaxID=414 RepID=A0AA35UMW5_METCP|nr:protein of unknown function [Methylococcus capsulatus]
MESIGPKIGCVPQTLLERVKRQQVDAGGRERLRQFERENKELRRVNDILKAASAFFARAELDRRHGVESLWEPWRRALPETEGAEADAGRRGPPKARTSPVFCSRGGRGCPVGFRKKMATFQKKPC